MISWKLKSVELSFSPSFEARIQNVSEGLEEQLIDTTCVHTPCVIRIINPSISLSYEL